MINNPGESRMEIAAAWAAFLDAPCEESTNLPDNQYRDLTHGILGYPRRTHICRAYTRSSSVMITVNL